MLRCAAPRRVGCGIGPDLFIHQRQGLVLGAAAISTAAQMTPPELAMKSGNTSTPRGGERLLGLRPRIVKLQRISSIYSSLMNAAMSDRSTSVIPQALAPSVDFGSG